MNKEKDFFKTCFNTVAGLEVKNESQAIAKEVVLSEIENLQEENKKQKEVIDKARECIKNFLCTEEYITINGIAIADNYAEVLDMLNEVSE